MKSNKIRRKCQRFLEYNSNWMMVYVFIYFHSDFIEMRKNTEYMPKNKSILDEYFKTVIDIFVRVNYKSIPIQTNMYQIIITIYN